MNLSVLHRIKKSVQIIIGGLWRTTKNHMVKSTQVGPDRSRTPTGRPNLDEIIKRNAEEERRERKLSYTITGIMALLILVGIVLVYFFA